MMKVNANTGKKRRRTLPSEILLHEGKRWDEAGRRPEMMARLEKIKQIRVNIHPCTFSKAVSHSVGQVLVKNNLLP